MLNSEKHMGGLFIQWFFQPIVTYIHKVLYQNLDINGKKKMDLVPSLIEPKFQ